MIIDRQWILKFLMLEDWCMWCCLFRLCHCVCVIVTATWYCCGC